MLNYTFPKAEWRRMLPPDVQHALFLKVENLEELEIGDRLFHTGNWWCFGVVTDTRKIGSVLTVMVAWNRSAVDVETCALMPRDIPELWRVASAEEVKQWEEED